jgi:hypothetical protein
MPGYAILPGRVAAIRRPIALGTNRPIGYMVSVLCGMLSGLWRWLTVPPEIEGVPAEDDREVSFEDLKKRWEIFVFPIVALPAYFLTDQWAARHLDGFERAIIAAAIFGLFLPWLCWKACHAMRPDPGAQPTIPGLLDTSGNQLNPKTPLKFRMPWVDRKFLWCFRVIYFLIGWGWAGLYAANGRGVPQVIFVQSATTHYRAVRASEINIVPAVAGSDLFAVFYLDCAKEPEIPENMVVDIELDLPTRTLYKLGDPTAEVAGDLMDGASEPASVKGADDPAFHRQLSLKKIDRKQKTTILIRISPEKSAKPAPPYADVKKGLHIELNKWNGITLAE